MTSRSRRFPPAALSDRRGQPGSRRRLSSLSPAGGGGGRRRRPRDRARSRRSAKAPRRRRARSVEATPSTSTGSPRPPRGLRRSCRPKDISGRASSPRRRFNRRPREWSFTWSPAPGRASARSRSKVSPPTSKHTSAGSSLSSRGLPIPAAISIGSSIRSRRSGRSSATTERGSRSRNRPPRISGSTSASPRRWDRKSRSRSWDGTSETRSSGNSFRFSAKRASPRISWRSPGSISRIV